MLAIDRDSFEQEVLQSSEPVVVEFWGEQCSVCVAMMPEVEDLAKNFDGRVKFCKIPIAGSRRLCIELKVMTVPVFLFYKNGELVDRLANQDLSVENIRAKAESLLN